MRFSSFKLHRARTVYVPVLVCALGWLLTTPLRSRVLLRNGRVLAQKNADIPRGYFVGKAGSPLLTYLVMGDSTAAGFGAPQLSNTYSFGIAQAVAARGHLVRVVNVAVGGATIADVRRGQLAFLKSVRPDLVTLSVGANDTTHFTPEDGFARELHTIISAFQSSTARTVLVANTPDMYQVPALPLPLSVITGMRARRQNGILQQSLQGSKIKKVDLYGHGKLIFRRNPNLYAADFFHPSALGYQRWTALFVEQLGAI